MHVNKQYLTLRNIATSFYKATFFAEAKIHNHYFSLLPYVGAVTPGIPRKTRSKGDCLECPKREERIKSLQDQLMEETARGEAKSAIIVQLQQENEKLKREWEGSK